DVDAGRDLEPHEARLGEGEVEAAAGAGDAHGGAQVLAAAEEVALGQRDFAEEALGRREADGGAVVAGRTLDHGEVDDHLVRGAARLDADVDGLEEAELLDGRLAALHHGPVERVAFGEAQFTANDVVARLVVAGDVDALDVEPRTLVHQIGDVEGLVGDVAVD